jgi:hypothetical protein
MRVERFIAAVFRYRVLRRTCPAGGPVTARVSAAFSGSALWPCLVGSGKTRGREL